MISGEKLRDAGIASIANSKPRSVDQVTETIEHLARIRALFTADDVRLWLYALGVELEHHNTIGAAFHRAARAGVIVAVGYRPAEHPSAHRRVLRVWTAA